MFIATSVQQSRGDGERRRAVAGGLVPGTAAVMVVVVVPDKDAAAVARPFEPVAFEMVATVMSEELQLTVVVRSWVVESV